MTVAEVVAVLDEAYPPEWAGPGVVAGLVSGDPAAHVRRVLFTVDTVAAAGMEPDLVVAHHPPSGRSPAALYLAGSNAELANPGISGTLADRLGLLTTRPLVPVGEPRDVLVTFVPDAELDGVTDALAAAGGGVIGNYRRCAWTTAGTGTFLPGLSARPAIGRVGQVKTVPETRMEMVVPRARRTALIAALRAAHPYEEPAYYLCELVEEAGARGHGRVGELPGTFTLAEFVALATARLPTTPAAVRASGDPGRPVRTVAVCGGAGEPLLPAAVNAGVDAYLAGAFSHHAASRCWPAGGPALVEAGHRATVRPWLERAAARLAGDLGSTVEVAVCDDEDLEPAVRAELWTIQSRGQAT